MYSFSPLSRTLSLLLFWLSVATLFAQSPTEHDGWQLVRDEEGVTLYVKSGEDSLRQYKAVTTLNVELNEAKKRLMLFADYANWMHHTESVEVIGTERDGSTNLYIRTSAPALGNPRDIVTNLIFSQTENAIIGRFTNRPTLKPAVEGMVRVQFFSGFVIARQQPGEACKFIVQYEIQMSNNLPTALIDAQMEKIVAESVKAFGSGFQVARSNP